MDEFPSLTGKSGTTHLPRAFGWAHELCFAVHDIMVQMLKSGEDASVFKMNFTFRDDADRTAFAEAQNPFEWLEQTHRTAEREALLTTVIFPALLSDMLHYVYEALETSRRGKLSVTYSLLRKPIQENLLVFEIIAADRSQFASKLTSDPTSFNLLKQGSLDAYVKRIEYVVGLLKRGGSLDASYLASLRYTKVDDGFDIPCNKATHLFTSHPKMRTEPFNINFIFSTYESKLSQWKYLYSRLPYLLVYVYRLVEHVYEQIVPTEPSYLQDMNRRVSAHILLWWEGVDEQYREPRLQLLALDTREWLRHHCVDAGCLEPNREDLVRMANTGAYPREAEEVVAERRGNFERLAKLQSTRK